MGKKKLAVKQRCLHKIHLTLPLFCVMMEDAPLGRLVLNQKHQEGNMELFSIDKNKCRKDGICAAVCPMALITLKTEDGFPAPVRLANELCMNCGHCVAVCPHGVYNLRTMKFQDCPPIQAELLPIPEQMDHLFRSRRSVRRFKEAPVPHDTLSRLIDMARYAPTGHNRQQVHWLVIEDPAEVQNIAGLVVEWKRMLIQKEPNSPFTLIRKRMIKAWELGMDYICHKAPHLILAHEPQLAEVSVQDSAIALTYLELAAASLKIGVCWAGFVEMAANFYPPLTKNLELPDNHKVMGALLTGYSKFQYQRLPLRNAPMVRWR